MSKYWSTIAHNSLPYVPGEQPTGQNLIKINQNENPYPPSAKVLEVIRKVEAGKLRLYPDPLCLELRKVIAQQHGLSIDQVFVGNGSDEVLAFSFMAFFNPGNPILFPDVSYTFYPVYANLFQLEYRKVPLNEDFSLPVEAFLCGNGGIVIANPNAPTGCYLPICGIRRILDGNPDKIVLIDEAYIDFGGESAIGLIPEYPNLLIVHTLSKSHSLAGMRVGFALGQKELMLGLERIKNSFNSYTLDYIAQVAAHAAIQDREYFEWSRNKVINTRNSVSQRLLQMGFIVVPSQANFLLISHADLSAQLLFNGLRERRVLVRYFELPRIDNYLRVSIGTDKDMDIFLQILSEIIEKIK